MIDDRRTLLFDIVRVGHVVRLVGAVEARADGSVGPSVEPDQARETLFGRRRQGVVGGAHISEHGAALRSGYFERVQDREERELGLIGRIGVPVGCALDAVPVDLAGVVDIAQPGHLGDFGVAVGDERVLPWRAEAAPESRELCCAEMLVAKHQHRMLGKGPRDPGEGRLVDRLRQVDAECLSAERLAERAQLRCIAHRLSSIRSGAHFTRHGLARLTNGKQPSNAAKCGARSRPSRARAACV